MKRVLFVSYDGLTDPLGQSQVIPYLAGLSKIGYEITILSTEKPENFSRLKNQIEKILSENNVRWVPVKYHKKPPILSSVFDVRNLMRKAKQLHAEKKFDIVHCRSYMAAMVGQMMKKKFGCKFLFDMRGFWADERVDGGLWNLSRPHYKMVFNYFKKKEKEFFQEADHIISLTQNGADEIHNWKNLIGQPLPITVIPCCCDMNLFDRKKVTEEKRIASRKKLSLTENDLVLSYVGSVGTWYLADKMVLFFQRLLLKKPNAKFLLITQEPPELIYREAEKLQIPKDKFIITKAQRAEVPELISLSTLAVFFIKNAFSKKASSPVKQGEIMSMGIPLVCNAGIGDTDKIVNDCAGGISIADLTAEGIDKALENIDSVIKISPDKIRDGATKWFSLDEGIRRYEKVYAQLFSA